MAFDSSCYIHSIQVNKDWCIEDGRGAESDFDVEKIKEKEKDKWIKGAKSNWGCTPCTDKFSPSNWNTWYHLTS